jgi:hypothetical protein
LGSARFRIFGIVDYAAGVVTFEPDLDLEAASLELIFSESI